MKQGISNLEALEIWYQSQSPVRWPSEHAGLSSVNKVSARTLSSHEGTRGIYPTWDGEGNEGLFIRGWIPLPSRRVLKTVMPWPKRTISTSGDLGTLQLASELTF